MGLQSSKVLQRRPAEASSRVGMSVASTSFVSPVDEQVWCSPRTIHAGKSAPRSSRIWLPQRPSGRQPVVNSQALLTPHLSCKTFQNLASSHVGIFDRRFVISFQALLTADSFVLLPSLPSVRRLALFSDVPCRLAGRNTCCLRCADVLQGVALQLAGEGQKHTLT